MFACKFKFCINLLYQIQSNNFIIIIFIAYIEVSCNKQIEEAWQNLKNS